MQKFIFCLLVVGSLALPAFGHKGSTTTTDYYNYWHHPHSDAYYYQQHPYYYRNFYPEHHYPYHYHWSQHRWYAPHYSDHHPSGQGYTRHYHLHKEEN